MKDIFLDGLRTLRGEAEKRVQEATAELECVEGTLRFYESLQPKLAPATPEEVRRAVTGVLLASDAPLHRKEILERLSIQGIHLNGKDEIATLSAALSRFGDDFQSCGDGVWGLREHDTGSAVQVEAAPVMRSAYMENDLPW